MEIKGPLKIGVIDNDDGSRELHLDFTNEFRGLNLEKQSEEFHEFLLYLRSELDILEEHDPNHQGMMTILQICEQVQPRLDANEVPLDETIVVNIEVNNLFGNIE